MSKSICFWSVSILLLGALPAEVLLITIWSGPSGEATEGLQNVVPSPVSLIGSIFGLMAGSFIGAIVHRERSEKPRALALPLGALFGSHAGLSAGLSIWPTAHLSFGTFLAVLGLVHLGGISGILLGSRFLSSVAQPPHSSGPHMQRFDRFIKSSARSPGP